MREKKQTIDEVTAAKERGQFFETRGQAPRPAAVRPWGSAEGGKAEDVGKVAAATSEGGKASALYGFLWSLLVKFASKWTCR